MTDAQDAIERLRAELADPSRPLDYRDVIVPNEDARAILAAYDTAVSALAQRDAQIVAWLRKHYRYDDTRADAIEAGKYKEAE
jgi:hypothetical protein